MIAIFSAFCLVGFRMWDYIEGRISRNNASRYKPFPLPSPEERKYEVSDISVIVPTISADENFSRFLCRWLSNNPREIILVTVESDEFILRSVVDSPDVQAAVKDTKLELLTVKRANKREQLCVGINASSGKIIALVDDDAFYRTDGILLQLLAPFQQDDIGLVGGPIHSYVPSERKHGQIITPWEVAAVRIRQRRGRSMRGAFAADGGTNFTVSGLTMLLRAEILKDPEFQQEFTNDLWMGKKQNTGDDGFITRWVLYQHHSARTGESAADPPKQWKLGMQLVPEAEISTSVMSDSRYAGQMKRWWRSGLRLRLTCLLYDPGFFRMYSTTPYMARKMAEGLINPIITILRLILWFNTIRVSPDLAYFVMVLDLYLWMTDLARFAWQFPWCRSKLWAAIIVDRLYLISDWYCWLTLGTESWATRAGVDGDDTLSFEEYEVKRCGYQKEGDDIEANEIRRYR